MTGRVGLGLTLAALVCAVACGGGGASPTGPSPVTPTPTPLPTPTAVTARYSVVFQSDFPSNAHFSPLIGGTHSRDVRFWAAGASASAGIEAMAEQGRTSPLDLEVQVAISAGTAYSRIQGGAVARSPGVAVAEFEIDREHPLVSLVTMVAPSPDWFVGIDSLSLVEAGDWVTEKTVTLYPWDAGTDSGATYGSPDQDQQPPQPIRALQGYPVALEGMVAPFGSFSFRRIS
jgi:Spondin_N